MSAKNRSAIVIGAGVIGSAVAFELARDGWNVTVIDKAGGPGQGSTSSSSSIIRFNYSTYAGVVLAWESFQTWLDWRAHLGAAPEEQIAEMVNLGVVMLDVPVMNIAATTELFNKVGIEYEIWDARTLAARIPGIDPGKFWPPKPIDDPAFWEDATDSTGALYTPAGGYISDPSLSAVNLADAAKRHGANFRFKEEIVSVIKSIDRVTGVRLASGEEVLADVVVNVAGPWSGKINAMAEVGNDFTVELAPMRQEVHHVDAPPGMESGPMIGDLDVGVYMRPTPGGGFLVGGTEPECEPMQWIDDPDQAHMLRTQELYDAQVTRAARRFPDLKVPPVAKGIAGVYDVSSDWTPIYDKSELPGFYLAIGTSGNQFKNAPGAGVIMAKLIDYVEGGGDHDVNPLVVTGVRTGLPIDLATFSRKRPRNENSSGTVMG
ncbi:unannotated protein [freshwater metagenome]|uniref:Unannotated protein n=1 Tax=freshwater metagenome TaxID=449393 RepID=A0A6J7BIY7_9ZZZZ|nr:FAD-dependent oxidoreductase [Actinomycetota bacterium]MSY87837.1 FAD-dependent oxidoreductase [Actinomycetota bacterium]